MATRENTQYPSDAFIRELGAKRRPLVLGHVTPDADAIGAAFGLATAMRERDIAAVCGMPRATVANKLEFMLHLAEGTPRCESWDPGAGHDAVIVLDTAGPKRINIEPTLELGGSIDVFNIDHHISNTDFGRYNWVDPHATSTCELVTRLLRRLDWGISPRVASLLYAGIHGDTGGFSLPSTTADALETAAVLLRSGADVAHIGEQLCRSQVRSDFELLRRVYDHTVVTDGQRIAYSHLTHADFVAADARAEDIDDQVSIPLALKGVRIAMLFTEGEKGVIRINLRGEGGVTVIEIAERFGGGGHAHAAGVRVRGKPMQAVIDDVVKAAQTHLDSQPNG